MTANVSPLDSSQIDATVDTRGEICPYPLMDARDVLKGMAVGQVLEVFSDYGPAANETIPNFCEKKHYPYRVEVLGDQLWRVLIEKAD